MKFKWFAALCCIVLLVCALTCAVYADTETAGYTVAGTDASVTCTLKGETGKEQADVFTVSYSGSDLIDGNQYVLLIVRLDQAALQAAGIDLDTLENVDDLEGKYTVKESNILYIDQAAAAEGSVSFSNFIPSSVPDSVVLLGGTFQGDAASPKFLGAVIGHGVRVSGKVTAFSPKVAGMVYLYELDKSAAQLQTVDYMDGSHSSRLFKTTGYSVPIFGPSEQANSNRAEYRFSIEGVPDGIYTLVAFKPGHTHYIIAQLVVNGSDIDLSINSNSQIASLDMIPGDINENGLVEPNDPEILFRSANWGKPTDGMEVDNCDINGSGSVEPNDPEILFRSANWNKPDVKVDYTA